MADVIGSRRSREAYIHIHLHLCDFFFNILDVCVYGAVLVRVVGERKGCQN